MSDIKELYENIFEMICEACKVRKSSVYENKYPFPLVEMKPVEMVIKTILCPFIFISGVIAILAITIMVLCFTPLICFYWLLIRLNDNVYKRAKKELKDVNRG
jgi:hypothetical protein